MMKKYVKPEMEFMMVDMPALMAGSGGSDSGGSGGGSSSGGSSSGGSSSSIIEIPSTSGGGIGVNTGTIGGDGDASDACSNSFDFWDD